MSDSFRFQKGDPKLHFWTSKLGYLDPDFKVSYLYEFVVEFSIILH